MRSRILATAFLLIFAVACGSDSTSPAPKYWLGTWDFVDLLVEGVSRKDLLNEGYTAFVELREDGECYLEERWDSLPEPITTQGCTYVVDGPQRRGSIIFNEGSDPVPLRFIDNSRMEITTHGGLAVWVFTKR